MANFYFKSCCDSNTTFTIKGLETSLTVGNSYHVVIPNYFTGCSEVVLEVQILPGSPSYASTSATLTGPYNGCGLCNETYPCQRITETSECKLVTISELSLSCSADSTTSTITISASGGTPPYTYSWSNGFLGPVLTNAVPGVSYTITVTDYSWPTGGPDFTATTVCGLPPATPSPTPTPTPTPTPIPINNQTLCFTVIQNNQTTQYTFYPTQNIVNGKFTWTSSTYTLQWVITPTPQWQFTVGTSLFFNPNQTVIGSYSNYGTGAKGNMTTGACTTPPMTLLSPRINAPTCEKTPNTGSINIQVLNPQLPVLYSINGGQTTQMSPLFNNLPSGTYNIWVQDATPTTLTSSVTVPQAPPQTEYSLQFSSTTTTISATQQRLNFTLKIINSQGQQVTTLPTGTIITFSLEESNIFKVTNNSSFGSKIVTIQVLKNGSFIPSPQVITNIISPISVNNVCTGSLEYSTGTTTTYNNITISGNDVIAGYAIVSVTNISNQACYVKSIDKFIITSSSVSGCACCAMNRNLGQSSVMTTTKNGTSLI